MLKLVSKHVTALKGTPRIYEFPFEELQEQLSGQPALGPNKTQYDSGKPRQTRFDEWLSGFGPNDRMHNPGAGMGLDREDPLHKDRGVSSGYNDGGRADDESGPGNTSITPDPYWAVNTNDLFLDLEMKSGNRDAIDSHLNAINHGNPVVPMKKHRRLPVDRN